VLKSEDSLLDLIVSCGVSHSGLLDFVQFEYLSAECFLGFVSSIDSSQLTPSIWSSIGDRLRGSCDEVVRSRRFVETEPVSVSPIDSVIVREMPAIFSIFGDRKLDLLYRGSRDGFGSSVFHNRCDGRSRTVTIVETAKGFVFGGYTPLAWKSSPGEYAADDSLKSFVFTLKNGHGIAPKRFSLKSDGRTSAIVCSSRYGPIFGSGNDFYIGNNANTGPLSGTNFGDSYANDTGVGSTFLAGESAFTVKEIEVFQVRS
jgi:hypothetical protein